MRRRDPKILTHIFGLRSHESEYRHRLHEPALWGRLFVALVNGTTVTPLTTTRAPTGSTAMATSSSTSKQTSSSSTTITATSTGVTAPGPTQAGIISTCNKFAESISGLGCYDFAVAEGITPAQLYAWNTILGVDGADCGAELWADEYYCVGVSGSSTPTSTSSTVASTTTSVTAAGPTQSGIISTCNKFAESISGLGCYDFAVAEGITPAQLYTWNTILGVDGADCGAELWADEWYCVGVSS